VSGVAACYREYKLTFRETTKFGDLTFGEVKFGKMTTVGEITFGEMVFGDLTFVEMTSIHLTQKSPNTVLYCFCCVATHLAYADNNGRSQ